MKTDATYNGWTNYETWCVNVWLTNDEGLDSMVREWAETNVQHCIDHDKHLSEAANGLAQSIEDHFDENMPECTGVYSDLLISALGRVDWHDIASHYVDDIPTYTVGRNMPGYMPDADPATFIGFDDAHAALIEDVERMIEEAEDADADDAVADGQFNAEQCDALREFIAHLKSTYNLTGASATVAGVAFWIVRNGGTAAPSSPAPVAPVPTPPEPESDATTGPFVTSEGKPLPQWVGGMDNEVITLLQTNATAGCAVDILAMIEKTAELMEFFHDADEGGETLAQLCCKQANVFYFG